MALSSKQRSRLRAIGNELTPILMIGKGGINENLVAQLDEALTARELVKARVLPHTEFEPREVAASLSQSVTAEVIQVIGRNILFFRPPRYQPSIYADILKEV